MGDLRGLTSQLSSSSFAKAVKLGVPFLDAACTVGLNYLSVARNPVKPTQSKLKYKNKILALKNWYKTQTRRNAESVSAKVQINPLICSGVSDLKTLSEHTDFFLASQFVVFQI